MNEQKWKTATSFISHEGSLVSGVQISIIDPSPELTKDDLWKIKKLGDQVHEVIVHRHRGV